MRKILSFIVCIVFCVASMAAQDSIKQYTDTFKLQDQTSTASTDDMLWQMLAEQGKQLHAQDSSDMTFAEALQRDSLIQDSILVDSLRQMNSEITQVISPVVPIETTKSWIKDEQEDRNAALRAIRDKKTPWRKELNVLAQLTQNYATPNWYQGGSSSFAMIGQIKGKIGYYSQRFTWENIGEWRAGFSTVSGDSLRKFNTTDDLFKLYSKANYQAYEKLFYSFSAEFETRFFPIYKANSTKLKSGPFSPLRLNLALGLDYKPVQGLSISFSPAAFKLVHVADTIRMNQTDYSVPVGKKTLAEFGSSLRVEYNWQPVREISIETEFYMYTNYKRVELDLQVNCDFIINRYLSTRITLHPRYDNTVIYKDDERAKIQFKELISVGFAHKFH